MRILLVEDDTMIGESLREALRRRALACDWVRDGRAADAVLASERFDAVLLDLGLPQRDAHDALNDAVMAALAFVKLRRLCGGD